MSVVAKLLIIHLPISIPIELYTDKKHHELNITITLR